MILKNKVDKYSNIVKELNHYRKKDFSFANSQILGSMCTQPHPIVKEIYMNFLETNLGDPELFPGTNEIEKKFILFISNLLNAPSNSSGQIVSGGTEGNITAMWLAKKMTNKKEIVIPDSAHFSFQKIASLMDLELVPIELNENYFMDIDKLKEKIGKNTAAVVGVAGSTELGTVDPIPEISDVCVDNNIFLHVDAAFGGFVIPFLKHLGFEVPNFDFKLPGVSTISVDAHKMGFSAIPVGSLVVRNKKWLDEISVESNCVSSDKQASVLGTRPGGSVAAAYAVTRVLGIPGYRDLVRKCMDTTHYAMKKISEINLSVVVKPTMNVLGVKVKNPTEIVKRLTKYSWKVNKMERLSCIRMVLMPHVTTDVIDKFIPDLEKVCKEVGEF